MTYTTDRVEFIRQMREEFANHNDSENIPDPPTPDQVRKLFRYLNGRQVDIDSAFRSYLDCFYLARRGVYISYPGGAGDTCESWSEVLRGERIGNRHVIDCDGYAVIAVELLKEAGFQFVEYIYASSINEYWEIENTHIVAVMRLNSTTIYLSNDAIYNSLQSSLSAIGWDRYIFSTGQTVHEAWIEALPMWNDIGGYSLIRRIHRYLF